jgi:hypothetical protein
MKRIVYWLLSTVTVVVLLFGYRTSLAGPLARQGKTVASSPPPAAASGSTTAGTASRTVTGPVVQTQWGPVQVQVKVNGGKLADVSVLQSRTATPGTRRSTPTPCRSWSRRAWTPRAPDRGRAAWARVMAELREVDAVFSTYRPDSFVSRLGRGEIALEACPPEMAEVLARASWPSGSPGARSGSAGPDPPARPCSTPPGW